MRRNQKTRIQQTVATHFPSLSCGHDINGYVRMFQEDIQLTVMPIGGRTEKHQDFTVVLEGKQSECKKAELLIAQIGNYDRFDLAGKVCEAVKKVVQYLAGDGCAVFEILQDDEGLQSICGFTSKCLWRLPKYYLQIVPRRDWKYWNNKKFTIVSADNIWRLEMPSALGGRRGYKKILKNLGKFERLGPKFFQQDLQNYEVRSTYFDHQWYGRNSDIYCGRVARSWGWTVRDLPNANSTEFYSIYKMVEICGAQAILREHVINEFNRFFKRLRINCEIKVRGLPKTREIVEIRNELLDGKISFRDALDSVRL